MSIIQPQSTTIQSLQQYNTNRILNSQFHPILLNLQLLANPFLQHQQNYNYLIYKLNQYNQKAINNLITDPYQSMFYQRLHSVLYDIGLLGTKDNQITRLKQTIKWTLEQENLINQRKNQGIVRYEITKQSRYKSEVIKKQANIIEQDSGEQLMADMIDKEMLPYQKHWRTVHKQLDVPSKRLSEYKRKIFPIASLFTFKQQKKPAKICYPRVKRFDNNKFEQRMDDLPKTSVGTITPVTEIGPKQIQNKQQKYFQQKQQQQKEQQQQQDNQQQPNQQQPDQKQSQSHTTHENPPHDLPQSAQQKQQQQPQEDERPPSSPPSNTQNQKHKLFSVEFQDIKRKQYTIPFMHYKGGDNQMERNMEQRYVEVQQQQLMKQKEDREGIQFMDQWAAKKYKLEKQLQKKLENCALEPQFAYSTEQPPNKQMLSHEEEHKFGFTQNLLKPKPKQLQLHSQFHLPQIGQLHLSQQSIRKDRLKSLRSKYGNLLNLKQQQKLNPATTLCQYTSRRRGFSQIIYNHSKEKERLKQLDEVNKIKEKMVRNKFVIDMKALSLGLCAPEEEINQQKLLLPNKLLLSNPFMTEIKKKKKKKAKK